MPEESKNFSFHQKEEKGGEVRRTERKWKSLSKQEREAFLAHAHENHERNDSTKEKMREARKDIVKKNQESAAEERTRKVNNKMQEAKEAEEASEAKRAMRDARYTSRYVTPEKAKIMGFSQSEAPPRRASRCSSRRRPRRRMSSPERRATW